MGFYKIFMLIAVPALAIGWYLYWRWTKKIEEEEKNRPKEVSKQLQKSRTEVSDWAKKLANSESPGEQARKRRLEMEKKWEEEEKKQEQQKPRPQEEQ
jgi:F0F1-type ATP synthase membrane subunit b/b'